MGVDGDAASSIIWSLKVGDGVTGPGDGDDVVGRGDAAFDVGLLVGTSVGASDCGDSVAMGATDGESVGSLLVGPDDGTRLSSSDGEKVGKDDCGAEVGASEKGAPLGTSGQASRVLGLEEGSNDATADGNAEGYCVTRGVGVIPAVVDTVVFVAGADRALMVATVPAVTPTAATVATPTVIPIVAPAAAPAAPAVAAAPPAAPAAAADDAIPDDACESIAWATWS